MTTPSANMPPPAMPVEFKNGFGVTALVLGIVGAVFALIPIVGVIAWPLVILGLIFGILGIVRARKGTANNKGVAIGGTACSAVGLVLCFVWLVAFGASVANTPSPTGAGAPPANSGNAPLVDARGGGQPREIQPGTIPSDGYYMVGEEIQPGTYRSDGTGSMCYWERLSGTSGTIDDVIANYLSDSPTVVTIDPSDAAFKTERCGAWEKIGD